MYVRMYECMYVYIEKLQRKDELKGDGQKRVMEDSEKERHF